jgi:type I restriction enzyme S subunit
MLNTLENNTGLNSSDIATICAVFKVHPEIKKAIIFGSRAKGNFKPYSDIDLALVGDDLNLTLQQKIEGELDNLLMPYKFDLIIFHTIINKDILDHIKRVGKDFYVFHKLPTANSG